MIIAKEMFESFAKESTQWKKVIDNIKQGMSNTFASLLSQRLVEDEMIIDTLKVKLEEFFQLDVYERDDFENFSIFSNTMHTTQDLLPGWEESLGRAERAIAVVEFKQELTSINIEELDTVLDRFHALKRGNQG